MKSKVFVDHTSGMFTSVGRLLCVLALLTTHICVSSSRLFPPVDASPQTSLAHALISYGQQRAAGGHMSREKRRERLEGWRQRARESQRLKTIKYWVELESSRMFDGENVWNETLFDEGQHTVFLDVDDTIINSGSNFVAGIDDEENQISRSIPENEILHKREVYPRVFDFINLISAGATGNTLNRATGNLFVTTARPGNLGTKVKVAFEDSFQTHQPDNLCREPVGYLWGSKLKGTRFAMTAADTWARDKVREKANVTMEKVNDKLHLDRVRDKVNEKLHLDRVREKVNEKLHLDRVREKVNEKLHLDRVREKVSEKLKRGRDPKSTRRQTAMRTAFERLGRSKFERMRLQVLAIQERFPEYRLKQKLSFLGDNGQGDFYASVKLLQEGLLDFAFIHDVRNLKDFPKEDWAYEDPEAAGVDLYQSLPSELQERVFLFRTYEEAIDLASSIFSAAK